MWAWTKAEWNMRTPYICPPYCKQEERLPETSVTCVKCNILSKCGTMFSDQVQSVLKVIQLHSNMNWTTPLCYHKRFIMHTQLFWFPCHDGTVRYQLTTALKPRMWHLAGNVQESTWELLPSISRIRPMAYYKKSCHLMYVSSQSSITLARDKTLWKGNCLSL